MVTGASKKGNWVRLLRVPIEGMLKTGYQGIDVGDRIRVQLLSVDVEQGLSILGGSAYHDTDLTLFLLQALDAISSKKIQDNRYEMAITKDSRLEQYSFLFNTCT